jgi:hypothetical protein
MSDYKTSVKSCKDIRKAADNALKTAGYDCLQAVGKIITVYLSKEVDHNTYGELSEKLKDFFSNMHEHDCLFFDAIVQSITATIIGDLIYFDFKLISPINIDIYDIDGTELGLKTKDIPFDTLSVVVQETKNQQTDQKVVEPFFAKLVYYYNENKENEIYIFIKGIETQ